jgi:carboxylesterase
MPPELLAGAEPYSNEGSPAGVLVLHGFTGTPRSMRPLAETFAAAGYSVELPLLPGHGTRLADLVPTRFSDWRKAAAAAFERLAERGGPVVIAGHSMGGTVALSLAAERGGVAGLVLINPLVAPPAPTFLDLMRRVADAGTVSVPSIGSDAAKEGVSGGGYDATPVRPLLSLFEATIDLAPHLCSINCRALLFSSRQDHVVPPESSDLLERSYGGPLERVVLERSYHLAPLDHDAEEIEKRSLVFAEEVLGG